MRFLYLLYFVVALVVALIIDYIIAKKFSDIAEMKGHAGDTYFWFTFVFGIVGMLMVIALPIQSNSESGKAAITTLPPPKDIFAKYKNDSGTYQIKRCPHCGDVIKLGRCEMCGKEVK